MNAALNGQLVNGRQFSGDLLMQAMNQARSIAIGVMMSFIVARLFMVGSAIAAEKTFGPDAKKLADVRQRAINYLKTSQADDGTWTSNTSSGVTALAVSALIESGVSLDDPSLAKGLKALEKFVQKDGGIYAPTTSHKNYETCVSVMALKAADADGRYDKILARADKFLRGLQWDEEEGIDKADVRYGGADYGPSKKRPDLSNTQFLVDALKTLGAKEDDPNIQKALVFVSRCQNLESV